ncbi:creatininase family protein [Dyadobacter frigoris]|uniref:Creatininase family protein n=1 Tax=Dyadobacter frigoris TaxID=2576211 RepID=A0A4V6BKU0_9BACT|nr:creatininase family protein [Dyadobacter frigoris]TKT92223.1 creatininase family protein [Dyadobacter frigoris]GLU53399.1 creatininase [Dyadobacter frigoris]
MILSESNYLALNEVVQNIVVLLPLGAIEQHGPHLAVATDTDIVSAIAYAAEGKMADRILLCPTMPFGSSHHHLAFGGTLSISITTYTQVIVELVESLLQNGFRRIVLLNGHGGNITPVKQALAVLSNKYDDTVAPNIALATYWEVAGKVFAGLPPMESPALSHACEYETSLMLHLFPYKVFRNEIERATRPESNGYIPWEDDEPYRGVTMVKKTQFVSGNGSSGEPQLATAEKGQYLFEHAVESVVNFLNDFKSWPLMADLRE